jgi:hypothetical protein
LIAIVAKTGVIDSPTNDLGHPAAPGFHMANEVALLSAPAPEMLASRRSSFTTATMEAPDRRESTSRLRNGHARQTSDLTLFTIGRITSMPRISGSPELVPYSSSSDSESESSEESPPPHGLAKLKPTEVLSLKRQFQSLRSKPNRTRLLKILLGVACLLFVASVHSSQYAPAGSSSTGTEALQVSPRSPSQSAFLRQLVQRRDRRLCTIPASYMVHSNRSKAANSGCSPVQDVGSTARSILKLM